MFTRRSILIYLFLCAACIPLFFLNIHHTHPWGDDQAQYIMQAMNFANGQPYHQTGYVFNELNPTYAPPHYPPGFSLMIAPIVAIKGIAVRPILYFISVILSGLLFILFFYYRRYTNDVIAICLSLICVYCSGLVELKGQAYSDIPSWFFIALYLTLRNEQANRQKLAILITCMVAALLIRSQTYLLVIAEMIYLAIATIRVWIRNKRADIKTPLRSTSFIVVFFSLLFYFLIDKVLLAVPPNGYSTLEFYKNLAAYSDTSFWDTVGQSSNYLLDLFIRSFHYYPGEGFWHFIARILAHMIFVFAITGYFISIRKSLTLQDIFFTVSAVFLICFSQHQGIRFIVALLPIYLLYAFLAAREILPKMMRVNGTILATVFTPLFLLLGWWDYERQNEEHTTYMPLSNDLQAFSYIKEHVGDDEIILFEKPRALSLYTHKKSMVPSWQSSPQVNIEYLKQRKVKYLLTRDELNKNYYDELLSEMPQPLSEMNIAPGYILYTLR